MSCRSLNAAEKTHMSHSIGQLFHLFCNAPFPQFGFMNVMSLINCAQAAQLIKCFKIQNTDTQLPISTPTACLSTHTLTFSCGQHVHVYYVWLGCPFGTPTSIIITRSSSSKHIAWLVHWKQPSLQAISNVGKIVCERYFIITYDLMNTSFHPSSSSWCSHLPTSQIDSKL